MKKVLFVLPLLAFASSVFSVTYDSSTLTNKVSQNKSLADTFFSTFSDFVNDLCFSNLDEQFSSYDSYEPSYSNTEDYESESESYDSEETDENYDYDSESTDSESTDSEYDSSDDYKYQSHPYNNRPLISGLKFKTSLDAVYYTGFSINTDYGAQEGSLVQGYSDLLFGIKLLDVALAFGTAGSRYGVFLTDIDFNIPNGDPVTNVTVNDFMGTQIMTDIYTGVIGIKDIIWLGGYFFSSANYSPDDTGILSLSNKESSVDYWGLKGQFSSLLAADLLFDKECTLQSFDWSFDAVKTALFILQKPLHYNFNLTAGMSWYTKEELSSTLSSKVITKVNWNRFDIPLDLHYNFNTTRSTANVEGGLHLSVSDTFQSFYLGKAYAGITADHLFHTYYEGRDYYYRIGFILKGSYYADEMLQYHGNNDSTSVFGAQAGIILSPGKTGKVLINGTWRYNYVEDLKNLIESKDKHVFSVYATLAL